MNFYFALEGQLKGDGSLEIPRDSRFERLAESVALEQGVRFRVSAEGVGRGTARITALNSDPVVARFELEKPLSERVGIDVLLALPRPKVLRRLLPRIAAMGIRSLTLLNACGVKREYFDTHWLCGDNLGDLIMLGLEQGGACQQPSITVERRLKPFIEDRLGQEDEKGFRLVCTVDGDRVLEMPADARRAVLAIGPETGWTDYELALFANAGFESYSLGDEHLACDVAALAMVGVVKSLEPGLGI